jgi:hypothetical protein
MKPPADLLDKEEEYEMEAIIAHKKQSHGLQFLIKWKGYLIFNNSWEPQKNLKHASDILLDYKTSRHL